MNKALIAPLAIILANIIRVLTGHEIEQHDIETTINVLVMLVSIIAAFMHPKKKPLQ